MPPKGPSAVRAVLADGTRELARRRRQRDDPPPANPRGQGAVTALPGKWTPDALGLPTEDPCPVQPLGIEGDLFHLVDSAGQFRSMAASDFSHSGIQSLFAATPNWPQWAWPRYGRAPKSEPGDPPAPPPIKSFEDDAVRQALFLACSRRGLFSPQNRLRGRGAWRLKGGGLVYHAGEELWVYEGGRLKALETGLVENHFYARMASVPAPWPQPVTPADNPCRELLAGFRRWTWDRPDVDPVLLLGWLGVALIGGALDWRSAVFLIGDKETGKSTLQRAIKDVLGEAVISTADTSAAGIYQRMKHDGLAVAIDEMEASADNRKQIALLELARAAASGAFGLRGGADGTGTEFQMRSAFLFSAINAPPLMPQDLSRLAMLRLGALPTERGELPVIDAETTGRMMLTRLMSEWPRWEKALSAYRSVLREGGHGGRGQDTYGTLLAAADLLLGPELAEELGVPMVDNLDRWAELLAASALPEVEDALPNWRSCLTYLLQARVPVWRDGHRASVGQLLEDLEKHAVEEVYARTQLAQAGLGLLAPNFFAKDGTFSLAVPNQHPAVFELFQGTVWQGRPGAGAWAQALRQGEASRVIVADKAKNRVRINGVQTRCTLVDLKAFRAMD